MRQLLQFLLCLFFVIGIVGIGSPSPEVTLAATTTVNSEAELVAAINAANTNPGPDTIVLGSDISLATTTPFVANGENGLPSITSEIIIQGNGHRIVRTSAVEFRIFHVATTGSLWLDQVTLARGNVSSSGTPEGGAIYSLGPLTITRSVIGGNAADANNSLNGGGIWTRGTLSIVNSEVSYNRGSFTGGGIQVEGPTSVQVVRSQINRNNATSRGGGFYINSFNSTAIDILDSQVNSYVVGGSGGGIDIRAGYTGVDLKVLHSEINGNAATTDGGGIYFRGTSGFTARTSSFSMIDSSVSDNQSVGNASVSGGGIIIIFANTIITNGAEN